MPKYVRVITNFDHVYRSFYEKYKEFKYFKSIDENRLNEIIDLATNYHNRNRDEYRTSCDYVNVLFNYLKSKRDMTYDEKVIFYIFAFDPDFIHSYYSNKYISITKKTIADESDEEKRQILIDTRCKSVNEVAKYVREHLGYFDKNLYIFEDILIKKFYEMSDKKEEKEELNKEVFASDVNTDYSFDLLSELDNITETLSDEDINKIKSMVMLYSLTIPDYNYKDTVFHLVNQSSLLKINKPLEKMIFLINLYDPELKAFYIFNEYNTWIQMEEHMIEELGFYSREFILMEKLYANIYNIKPTNDFFRK